MEGLIALAVLLVIVLIVLVNCCLLYTSRQSDFDRCGTEQVFRQGNYAEGNEGPDHQAAGDVYKRQTLASHAGIGGSIPLGVTGIHRINLWIFLYNRKLHFLLYLSLIHILSRVRRESWTSCCSRRCRSWYPDLWYRSWNLFGSK